MRDRRAGAPRKSTARLFAIYAAISLIPVLVLGAVLALSLRGEARRRGLAEGRSEAALIAQTAVEPLLSSAVASGLTTDERTGLQRLVRRAIGDHEVLRLRVRDLSGRVAFAD